jgi:hypothetical protein
MASRRDAPRNKVEASSRSEEAPIVFPPEGDAKRRGAAPAKRAAPTPSSAASESRTPRTQAKSPEASREHRVENRVENRVEVSNEGRYRMIAEAAYLRAERRGFVPGREVEDWLAAEAEVERLLAAEHTPSPR